MWNWRGALQSKTMRKVVTAIFVANAVGLGALRLNRTDAEQEAFKVADVPAVAVQGGGDLSPPQPASANVAARPAPLITAAAKLPASAEPIKLVPVAGTASPPAEFAAAPAAVKRGSGASAPAGRTPLSAAGFTAAFSSARAQGPVVAPDMTGLLDYAGLSSSPVAAASPAKRPRQEPKAHDGGHALSGAGGNGGAALLEGPQSSPSGDLPNPGEG
jgi:hypothetical protein